VIYEALIFWMVAAYYVKHDKKPWFHAFYMLVPFYNLYVIGRVLWYAAGRCVFRAAEEPRG
jgi:hypothetical protein